MSPDDAAAAPRPHRLPSLDNGRFVAALLVTLYHNSFTVWTFTGQTPIDLIFRGGHSGVEYFFVLSGFIIYYIHAADFSQPRRVGAFFRKRAIRILPMLWLVLLGWGVLRVVLASSTTRDATGLGTLLLDMLLIPHGGPMVLGVTWTLQRELVFYAIFSLAILDRRAGTAVILLWQAAVVLTIATGYAPVSPLAGVMLDIHNLAFGLGMMAAMLTMRERLAAPRLWIGAGLVVFVALLLVEWRLGGRNEELYLPLGQVVGPIYYSLASAAIIIGLARLDQIAPTRPMAIARYAGGASYVMYLVHGPVSSLLIRVLHPVPLPAVAMLGVLTVGGVAAALALHVYLERPLIRRLSRRRRLAIARHAI